MRGEKAVHLCSKANSRRQADVTRGKRRQESAHVFDRADGVPWNPNSFSWLFAQLVKRSEFPKMRLHVGDCPQVVHFECPPRGMSRSSRLETRTAPIVK